MNQIKKTEKFYDEYGAREWERMDKTPYDRLNFILHMDFLDQSLQAGTKVCDAGCGAGRFSVEFAKKECKLTILDISSEQIRIAKEKLEANECSTHLEQAIIGNIAAMSMVEDNTFDVTVCYGAPLNYLYENYEEGIKELYRITKPGGRVFVSVNNRLGVVRTLLGNSEFDIVNFLGKPEYWHIDRVINEGDLPEHPEVSHPSRHFFESSELRRIFKNVGFENVEMGSSPCLSAGLKKRVFEISENPVAWETLKNLELQAYKKESTLDMGEFLMIKGSKSKIERMD